MASRFKYGDKVSANGHEGRVVSIKKQGNTYICKVKFDNEYLLPSEMDYEESLLREIIKPEDRCPCCYTKWTVTKFNNQVWKDCKKCNKTEEVISQEAKNKKSKNYWDQNYKGEDISFDEFSKIRAYRESIPNWMDELGVKELGEELWTKEIAAQNQQAKVILRVNTLKTTRQKLHAILMDLNIETEFLKDQPDALVLKERANVFLTDAFKDGFFEVQDANSQLVAAFLDVKPGMKVVDTCAGAGGKTLHMASLMENKGLLIAMDLYESKLKQLKLRAKRNGAFNIEYRIIDSTKVIKKLYEKADRVLIDAPCSGLGVLKRNPDSKWKLQPEFIDNIRKVQAEVLENYSRIVKPGGKLVYATCSVLPSENQEQVKKFLTTENGKNFIFVQDKKILASDSGFDGFYMALLERKTD
jgi:16S rRNA (cytosine967-C5)-methyltransferase